MEILSFKIKGRFAHFRKYYANNTAFSFSIPPRTTIMGMVAAIMGWEKDSYYERLSSEHIHFGLRVLRPLKKGFHRLNFLKIKSTGDLSKSLDSDFRGKSGRIQTPFEVVSAQNIAEGEVAYQIFIRAEESGKECFQLMKEQLLQKNPVYNITLGPANFQAMVYNEQVMTTDDITKQEADGYCHVHSAIPTKLVDDLQFKKEDYEQYNFVEEDLLPGDFVGNNNREVTEMNRLLFSITNLPLRVSMSTAYWNVDLGNEKLNIQFMDV